MDGIVLRGGSRLAAARRERASGAAQARGTESQRFTAFLETVYQQNLAASPQLATEFGSKTGNDRWDDTSEPALAAGAARVRGNMRTAKTRFDYARLDAASQLQYRVFLDEQQLLLDRYRWRDHFYALNQIVGLHIDIPGTLTGSQMLQSERTRGPISGGSVRYGPRSGSSSCACRLRRARESTSPKLSIRC